MAQTNSLVDSALGNQDGNTKKDTDAVKQLDQLGTSLSDLFSDLYKEPPQTKGLHGKAFQMHLTNYLPR